MGFSAPKNYNEIFEETISKTLRLIELGYIDIVEKNIVKKWLYNFVSPEEKYLATIILNSLIFRNEDAIIKMFQTILQVKLPKIFKKLNMTFFSSIEDLEYKIKTSSEINKLNFCISTIEGVDTNIGKSGEYLNRLLKKNQIIFKTINYNITSSNTKPNRLNTIIFIDDIVGTGTQFEKFYNKYKNKIEKFDNIIYIPLVGHELGINFLKTNFPNVIVEPLELLNKTHTFFESNLDKFDEINTLEDLRIFYNEMIKKKGLVIKLTGFELNTLYIFNMSSPNTNLPLIYCENESWNRLFIRY